MRTTPLGLALFAIATASAAPPNRDLRVTRDSLQRLTACLRAVDERVPDDGEPHEYMERRRLEAKREQVLGELAVTRCGFSSLLDFHRLQLRVMTASAELADDELVAKYPEGLTAEIASKKEAPLVAEVRRGARTEQDLARYRKTVASVARRVARVLQRHRLRAVATRAASLDVEALLDGDSEDWIRYEPIVAAGVSTPADVEARKQSIRNFAADQPALSHEEMAALVAYRRQPY